MITVDIPGGTATLRSRAELTVAQKRIIRSAAAGISPETLAKIDPDAADPTAALSFEQAEAVQILGQVTIVALLDSWTLDQPLPTLGTIDDMNAGLYDALNAATQAIAPDLAKDVDFGPAGSMDPDSPSGPSGISGTRLRASTVPQRKSHPTSRRK